MGDGFDDDTRELLKGVRSDAMQSYLRPSRARTLISMAAVLLFLALTILGLFTEKPLGYVIVLAGVSGLMLAAVGLTYRG